MRKKYDPNSIAFDSLTIMVDGTKIKYINGYFTILNGVFIVHLNDAEGDVYCFNMDYIISYVVHEPKKIAF